jgi:hypothetical protein
MRYFRVHFYERKAHPETRKSPATTARRRRPVQPTRSPAT